MKMKSLEDYTQETWGMVNELCYQEDGTPAQFKSDEVADLLWSTYDLWFGYLHNMLNGQCSIQASLDFDLEAEVMNKYREILIAYQTIKGIPA